MAVALTLLGSCTLTAPDVADGVPTIVSAAGSGTATLTLQAEHTATNASSALPPVIRTTVTFSA